MILACARMQPEQWLPAQPFHGGSLGKYMFNLNGDSIGADST